MMQHCNRNFLKREYFGPCHLISLALMKASYWHALKLTVANDSLRPVLDLRRHRVSDSNQPLAVTEGKTPISQATDSKSTFG